MIVRCGIAIAVLPLACVPLPEPTSSEIIGAVVVEISRGRPGEMKWSPVLEGRPFPMTLSDSEYAIFGFPPNSLLDERGDPLSASLLASLEVKPSSSPGSCGCAFAAPVLPLALRTGDSCPLPADVPMIDSSPNVDPSLLRPSIALIRGSCTNSPPPDDPFQPLEELELQGVRGHYAPYEQFAENPEGDLLVLSERSLVRLSAHGERTESSNAPFEGPVQAVTWAPGGRFITAEFNPRVAREFRFRVIEPTLESRELMISGEIDQGFFVYEMQTLRDGRLIIAGFRGELSPDESILVRCTLEDSLSCERMARVTGSSSLAATAVVSTSSTSDEFFVFTNDPIFFVGTHRDFALHRMDREFDPFEPPGAILSGDRLLFRANFSNGEGGHEQVIASTRRGWTEFRVEYRSVDGEGLGSAFSLPEGVVGFPTDQGNVVRIHPDRDPDRVSSSSLFGMDVREVRDGPKSRFVRTENGSLFRSNGNGHFERFLGSDATLPKFVAFIAPTPGAEGVSALTDAPMSWLTADGSTVTEQLIPFAAPSGWRRRATNAAFDSRDGSVVITGYDAKDGQLESWLARYVPSENTIEELSRGGRGRILSIAEVRPGFFAFVGDDWMYGTVTEVVEWSSFSPETESDPYSAFSGLDRGLCSDWVRSISEPNPSSDTRTWREVVAKDGTAWFMGCGGAIARLDSARPGSRPYVVAVDAALFPTHSYDFATGLAVGANRVILASRNHSDAAYDIPVLFEISPSSSSERLDHLTFDFVAESAPAAFRSGASHDRVVAVVGPRKTLTNVTSEPGEIPAGLVDELRSRRRFFRTDGILSAATRDARGRLFLGGDLGRIWVGR